MKHLELSKYDLQILGVFWRIKTCCSNNSWSWLDIALKQRRTENKKENRTKKSGLDYALNKWFEKLSLNHFMARKIYVMNSKGEIVVRIIGLSVIFIRLHLYYFLSFSLLIKFVCLCLFCPFHENERWTKQKKKRTEATLMMLTCVLVVLCAMTAGVHGFGSYDKWLLIYHNNGTWKRNPMCVHIFCWSIEMSWSVFVGWHVCVCVWVYICVSWSKWILCRTHKRATHIIRPK